MALVPCSNCGRPINPSVRCPHCGTVNALDDELARIERSITEMNLRDMAIVKERSQLASKLQAALFQRDILAHANAERAAHPCIGKGRADLVVAGCAILDAVCRVWPIERLHVADRGVREGILNGLIGKDLHQLRAPMGAFA